MVNIKESFSNCATPEEVYQKIIEWGERLPPFQTEWKREENVVHGCQSVMYLHAELRDREIFFAAASDALISAGLAAILIEAYNGTDPETVLKEPPTFLEELGIPASLTPGRANGLASLYLKMKQEALKLLLSL
ncbi:MAG: SufE family protein [Chlamydiales bacterium]|nr:SufE family protein [Chlamydiales bacterium]